MWFEAAQPVEVIFHLLSLYRRGIEYSARSIRAAIQKRRLPTVGDQSAAGFDWLPRIDFMTRLCQTAGLLDESNPPYPTLLIHDWLSWPLYDQISLLLNAWRQEPVEEKYRRLRTGLLETLLSGKELGTGQRHELIGLTFLKLCTEEQLNDWGRQILLGEHAPAMPPDPTPAHWLLSGQDLQVFSPPGWLLLWALDEFLDPIAHGHYLLDDNALRLAVQRGALQCSPGLAEVIKLGTGLPLPDKLGQYMQQVPTIRAVKGIVLEFSHPEDLKALRAAPTWRRALDTLLSPRHVAIDPHTGPDTLRQLCRQGLLSEAELAGAVPGAPSHEGKLFLSKAERAYLLYLALVSESLQNIAAAPPGLLRKLAGDLTPPLRAAAARKAGQVVEHLSPKASWPTSDPPGPLPPDEMVDALQQAIDRQEAVDISYRRSAQHALEVRHVTPLLIEKWAGRMYLVTYCHTRRANRTFRMDRIRLLDD